MAHSKQTLFQRVGQAKNNFIFFSKTLLTVSILALLWGCGGSSSRDVHLSDDDWRDDIDYLTEESERIHPDLFHSISRSEYRAAANRLKANIPHMTKAEIFTEIKRLVALPAQREDGHTLVTMFDDSGFRLYPLRLYEFNDGVYVIDAMPPHLHTIGQRVIQIGGKDIDQVNTILDPLITRDSETQVKWKRTLHYVVPEILETTGVIADAEFADYLLEDANGNFTTLLVEPVDKEIFRNNLQNTVGLPENITPLAMTDMSTPFWLQGLPADDALYVKYNWVFQQTEAGLTIAQFSNQVLNYVTNNNPSKIIVDVRHNGGGDATTYGPLLSALSNAQINQPGKLYIIIGRSTFSAAANFATEVEQGTHARFVGESTGGSPNNYGDSVFFNLPRSGFEIWIPTIYWVYSPGDTRTSITPDVRVEWSSNDYFNRLDPVLQAAIDE